MKFFFLYYGRLNIVTMAVLSIVKLTLMIKQI